MIQCDRRPTTSPNQSELIQLDSGTRQMCDFTFNWMTGDDKFKI